MLSLLLQSQQPFPTQALRTQDLHTQNLRTQNPHIQNLRTRNLHTQNPRIQNLPTQDLHIPSPRTRNLITQVLRTQNPRTQHLRTPDLRIHKLPPPYPSPKSMLRAVILHMLICKCSDDLKCLQVPSSCTTTLSSCTTKSRWLPARGWWRELQQTPVELQGWRPCVLALRSVSTTRWRRRTCVSLLPSRVLATLTCKIPTQRQLRACCPGLTSRLWSALASSSPPALPWPASPSSRGRAVGTKSTADSAGMNTSPVRSVVNIL